jgi:hypothetical protein
LVVIIKIIIKSSYISGFWAALGWWFLIDALFYDSLVRATGKETGVVLAMEVKKNSIHTFSL